jgi:hypothetical protein
MATATTSGSVSVIEGIVDVSGSIVKGLYLAVVAIAQLCIQLAVACPAIAVGLGAFIGACYVPLGATPEVVQPFLESYFPMLAGAGAFFVTLFISGKAVINTAPDS